MDSLSQYYDLYCWACVEGGLEKPRPLCSGNTVRIVATGEICHITASSIELADSLYLRKHTVKKFRDIKPFRMFCSKCTNQLGIVLIIDHNKYRPSFQTHSVLFINGGDQRLNPLQWKTNYAQIHPVVKNETFSLGKDWRNVCTTQPLLASTYRLSSTNWSSSAADVKPRMQVDQASVTTKNDKYTLRLDSSNDYYTVTLQ